MIRDLDWTDDRNFRLGDEIIGKSVGLIVDGVKYNCVGIARGIITRKISYRAGYLGSMRNYYLEVDNKILLKEDTCIRYTEEKWNLLNNLQQNLNKAEREFEDTLENFIKEEDKLVKQMNLYEDNS